MMGGADNFSKHPEGYKTHSGCFTETQLVAM